MEKLLLTVAEASGTLGVSRSLVYQMIKENKIPYIRIPKADGSPGDARIPVRELREWIDAQTTYGKR